MLWFPVIFWHSSNKDEVARGSKLEFDSWFADLEVVNGKDRLFFHLNHHFVPLVVVQILIVFGDNLYQRGSSELKPEHKLPVFESEFEPLEFIFLTADRQTAVVGVKQKPIRIVGFKLEADGAAHTSLPGRVLHVRILGPGREKGEGGGDAQGHQDQQRRESKE